MIEVRKDFPILQTQVHGQPLIYLDNAATMQMPLPVWEAMERQQMGQHANVHRGIHRLSEASTAMMENAREHIRQFLGAKDVREIIFTSGTTHGINMVASMFLKTFAQTGEEVLVTRMEHHSNYLPWRELSGEYAVSFVPCPVTAAGDLDLDAFAKLLTHRTLLVAVTAVSNVTGAVNPLREIIAAAHQSGAAVLVDCAQGMRHGKIDVQDLDCDFLVFSGHKIGGPTGTGILYGKAELLELLKPAAFGGGMVKEVTDRITAVEDLPHRLEAGTPNITGIAGLDAAVSYLESVGPDAIRREEENLLSLTEDILKQFDRVHILGEPKRRAGAISFNAEGLHCYDVAKLLDAKGIAVRSGHHCAMPLLSDFGLDGAVRVSPAFYNTAEEIEQFGETLDRILRIGS